MCCGTDSPSGCSGPGRPASRPSGRRRGPPGGRQRGSTAPRAPPSQRRRPSPCRRAASPPTRQCRRSQSPARAPPPAQSRRASRSGPRRAAAPPPSGSAPSALARPSHRCAAPARASPPGSAAAGSWPRCSARATPQRGPPGWPRAGQGSSGGPRPCRSGRKSALGSRSSSRSHSHPPGQFAPPPRPGRRRRCLSER